MLPIETAYCLSVGIFDFICQFWLSCFIILNEWKSRLKCVHVIYRSIADSLHLCQYHHWYHWGLLISSPLQFFQESSAGGVGLLSLPVLHSIGCFSSWPGPSSARHPSGSWGLHCLHISQSILHICVQQYHSV